MPLNEPDATSSVLHTVKYLGRKMILSSGTTLFLSPAFRLHPRCISLDLPYFYLVNELLSACYGDKPDLFANQHTVEAWNMYSSLFRLVSTSE